MRWLILLFMILGCQKNITQITNIDYIQEVTTIIQPELSDDFEINIDLIRIWVHDHAQHNLNLPDDADGVDPQHSAMVELQYYKGFGPKPNLFCGFKAKLLSEILIRLGYKARVVNILDDRMTEEGLGHILTEVLNPNTGLWEIVDSDMDQYYMKGGRRLGVLDMVFNDTSDVSICTPTGCSTRNVISIEGFDLVFLRDNFYKAAIIENDLYINRNRYDLNTRLSYYGNKTLLEVYQAYYTIKYSSF